MLLLACCLLAACLLLAAAAAAKPGRSTLDTKKGYKTKTGSTSSVTLTLTLALTLALVSVLLDDHLGLFVCMQSTKYCAMCHIYVLSICNPFHTAMATSHISPDDFSVGLIVPLGCVYCMVVCHIHLP